MQRKSRVLWLGCAALGLIAHTIWAAQPVDANFSIAYCDAQNHAINIYRDGDPEQPNAALKMRIYYRPDGITFLNTEASREPNPEGYNYSNIQGERQWTLFMPNSETSQCVLSRNGEVVDRGTVVRREPSSGD
jgi:hypothetical protein